MGLVLCGQPCLWCHWNHHWEMNKSKMADIAVYRSGWITELYISGESTPIFLQSNSWSKKHGGFLTNYDAIWRNLTSFLWQRLKVVTASQAQYWARGYFTPPWIFWKIFFIFAVNFHICQWEWFLWILFGLLRFIQRCTSYSGYPGPWKGMKN